MSVFEDNITPFNDSTSLYDRSSMSGMGSLQGNLGQFDWLKKVLGGGGGAADQGGTTPVKTPQGIFPSGWLGDILNGAITNSGSLMEMYGGYKKQQAEKKFAKEMRNRLREQMSSNILGPSGTELGPTSAIDPAMWSAMMSQANLNPDGDDEKKRREEKEKTTKTLLLVGAGGLAFVAVMMLMMKRRK